MEKRVLSRSAKRKRKNEKDTKDTALVGLQQIPSITTFFNKKREQADDAESVSLDNVHPADATALDASANYYPGPSAEEPSESDGAAAQPPLPLNNLSLMAIESELVRELDFDELINDFSSKKSRKRQLI